MAVTADGWVCRVGSAIAWAWAGLLLGVSFIATPVKFLAPSVSLADLLEVGQVTFAALRWCECVTVVGLGVLVGMNKPTRAQVGLFVALVALMAFQYGWLLPTLDVRTQAIIDGALDLPPSMLHWVYPVAEVVKVGLLAALGWLLAQPRMTHSSSK